MTMNEDHVQRTYRTLLCRLLLHARIRHRLAPEAAEDAVHQAVCNCLDHLARLPAHEWVAYAKTALDNVVYDRRRHERRRRQHEVVDLEEGWEGWLVRSSHNPEHDFIIGELVTNATDALAHQPAKDQAIMRLIIAELDCAKIARMTGRSPGAIRMQVSRVRRRIKDELRPKWGDL